MSIENNIKQNPNFIIVCHYPTLNKIKMFGTPLNSFNRAFKSTGGGVGVWNIKYKT